MVIVAMSDVSASSLSVHASFIVMIALEELEQLRIVGNAPQVPLADRGWYRHPLAVENVRSTQWSVESFNASIATKEAVQVFEIQDHLQGDKYILISKLC